MEKSCPTHNTRRKPQQPSDRDQLVTTRNEHVPSVSPHSPASIDPGFVKIAVVQLSQSVKTTNVKHTLTDAQMG